MVQKLPQLSRRLVDSHNLAVIYGSNGVRIRNSSSRTPHSELSGLQFPTVAWDSFVLCRFGFRFSRQHCLQSTSSLNRVSHAFISHFGFLRPLDSSCLPESSSASKRSIHTLPEPWRMEHSRVVLLCWLNHCGGIISR